MSFDECRPLSLLLDLTDTEWWVLEEHLLSLIAEHGSDVRVRIGLVLAPLASRPASISMGPYEEKAGRPLGSTRNGSLPHYEEHLMMRLLREVDVTEVQGESLSVRDLRRAECFSISFVRPSLAQLLIDACSSAGVLIAAIAWEETSAVAADLLWNGLILRHIVADHVIVTDYEEYPDNIDYSCDEPRWKADRTPEGPATGYFYNDIDGPHPEDRCRHLALPRDVQSRPLGLPPQTPLQRALRAAGKAPVLRISGHDKRELPASFKLPYIHLQFPDLVAVERKVRNYCLNRRHHERKWVGFLEHGYGYQPQDSIVLASQITGALLGKFSPKEVVATSGGELQFSVGVAIPSTTKHRALLTTARIAEPGTGFRLTTAYVDAALPEYADALPAQDPSASIEDAWTAIVERANEIVAGWTADGAWARPRVLIPRSGPTRAFARDLVRIGADHGTFSRAALGGRALLLPVGPDMSWSQAAFVAAYVQVQLGLRGILCLADVWVD